MVARNGNEHERSQKFDPQYEPLRDEDALNLNDEEVDGAVWFMYPTRATFNVDAEERNEDGTVQRSSRHHRGRSSSEIQYKWKSIDNRKGRHPLEINNASADVGDKPSATSFAGILEGIQRMATSISLDISYLGALAMTVACVFLVDNAILSVLPYAKPDFQPPGWVTTLEGVLTLVGCSLFLTSSSVSFVEAVNQDQRGCFGWSQEPSTTATSSGALESDSPTLIADWSKISRRNSITNLLWCNEDRCNGNGETSPLVPKHDADNRGASWRFLPLVDELRNHFLYDLGFIACSILLLSSAVYCASAAAALGTILTSGSIICWIRIPQFIASLGFISASALFMIETQEEWWRPQFNAIGW